MPDEQLDILIRSTADNTGFDQAAAGQAKLTEGSKDNEEQTIKLGNAHRDLHKAMHMVTEQSPLLGAAVRAALNPIGAAIGGALIIFKQVNDHIKEMIDLFDKLQEAAAGPIGNMKESMREAKEQIAQHNQEFQTWLENLKQTSGQVTEQLQRELDKIKEQTDAVRNLALARVDAMQAAGTISDADAERRKSGISGTLDKEASAKQLDAMMQAWSTLSGQLADAQVGMHGFKGQAEDSTRQGLINDLPKRIADMVKAVDALKDPIDKALKKKEAADKEAEVAESLPSSMKTQRETALKHQEEAQKELDDLNRLRGLEQRAIEVQKDKLEQLNLAQKKASDEAERLKAQFEGLTKELKQLTDQIKGVQAKAELQGPKADADALSALAGLQKTGLGGAAFSDVQQAEAIAKMLQNPKLRGGVSQEQIQQLIDTASAIAGHKVSLNDALGMMNWAMKDIQNFATDVGKLTDVMVQWSQAMAAANWPELKRRLSFVEQQVMKIKTTLPGG